MAKFIRYALAATCLAASVGCLALWQRSMSHRDMLIGPSYILPNHALSLESFNGCSSATLLLLSDPITKRAFAKWHRWYDSEIEDRREQIQRMTALSGQFGITRRGGIYFPHWFAALVFAIGGVVAMRVDRRFTLRSTLIATTVVAALLGMVAAL